MPEELVMSGHEYVGYDYKVVSADLDKAAMVINSLGYFGWVPDEVIPQKQTSERVTVTMKRDRKIVNRAELTRLQQHFEACVDEIAVLEKSPVQRGTLAAIVAGLVGCIFLAGSVFAVTAEPPQILWCVLLGFPGLLAWILTLPMCRRFTQRRRAEVTPLIDGKHDEIQEICRRGNTLVH